MYLTVNSLKSQNRLDYRFISVFKGAAEQLRDGIYGQLLTCVVDFNPRLKPSCLQTKSASAMVQELESQTRPLKIVMQLIIELLKYLINSHGHLK